MQAFTPKQRMLYAYKGMQTDRPPVAPEFWYYFPAKVLGLTMVEFEREQPFWQSLQYVFKKYKCEGWGGVFPTLNNQNITTKTDFKKEADGTYIETVTANYKGKHYSQIKRFDEKEPSYLQKRWGQGENLEDVLNFLLDTDFEIDTHSLIQTYNAIGEDYLPEIWLGMPFFDFIADAIGFEQAIIYFAENETQLTAVYQRFLNYQLKLTEELCKKTPFESFVIGCGYSCNSLIGPNMWRKWDKPYIKAIAELLHSKGRLLHIHFHGRSMECISDFLDAKIDCVCPFERAPGGDVTTEEQLHKVREQLKEKVTFNGNVHTVETLIFGTPQKVIEEVEQIKRVFKGSNRLIIGTGDQVGFETKEENIWAMIEQAKK